MAAVVLVTAIDVRAELLGPEASRDKHDPNGVFFVLPSASITSGEMGLKSSADGASSDASTGGSSIVVANAGNPPLLFKYLVTGTTLNGNDLATVEVFLLNAGASAVDVRGVQIDAPCSLDPLLGATGTLTTGAADADPLSLVSIGATSSGGVPRVFPGGLTPTNQMFCRAAQTGLAGESVSLLPDTIHYVATITYRVSTCAAGSFSMDMECGAAGEPCVPPPGISDQTRIVDPANLPVEFVPALLTLVVPTGPCCIGLSCVGDGLNPFCCEQTHPGAVPGPAGYTCLEAGACGCLDDDDCNAIPDTDPCRCNACVGGQCMTFSTVFGNISPCEPGCGGPDVSDILRVLDCFSGLEAFPGPRCNAADFALCQADGFIDVGDILEILAAFAGESTCQCDVCTGACCVTSPPSLGGCQPQPPVGGVTQNDCENNPFIDGVFMGGGTCCVETYLDCEDDPCVCLLIQCP
jgi:hypothetical protein